MEHFNPSLASSLSVKSQQLCSMVCSTKKVVREHVQVVKDADPESPSHRHHHPNQNRNNRMARATRRAGEVWPGSGGGKGLPVCTYTSHHNPTQNPEIEKS